MEKYILAAAATLATQWAWADRDCDSSLQPQLISEQSNYEYDMASLHLVTEENYTKSKESAAAKYGTLFGADFANFKEQRRKYFSESRYNLDIKDSKEVFRSYLSDAQLSAWLECKRDTAQPIVRYTRNGDEVTGVTIEWNPREPLGPFFFDKKVEIHNAKKQPALPKEIHGSYSFSLQHLSPSKPISGSINGHTGTETWFGRSDTWRDRSAYIYIPAVPQLDETIIDVDRPMKFVVPIPEGRAKTSWAYWQGKDWPAEPSPGQQNFRVSWECTTAPANMTLIVVGPLVPRHLGANKGQCVTGREYCTDSGAEYCTDLTIKKGCFVNNNWLAWYKMATKRAGLTDNDDQICDIQADTRL